MYIYGSSYTTSMDTIIIEDNVISTSYYGLYPRYAKYQKVHGNTINATGTYCYNYLYYPSVGIDVQNNTINAGTGYGFYVYSAPSGGSDMFAIVENNTINAGTYGIRVGGSASSTYNHFSDVSIKKNNITLTGSTNYGIYLYAVDGDGATVENNMISCAGTGSVYGIYSYHNGGVAYKHNTVNVTAGSATSGRACYFNGSTSTSSFTADSNTINNNIFVNTGGGYAFEASSSAPAGTHFTADYNNYYASSSSPFGPGSTTLSAWQTASSQDANSVWGDPLFVSATDLHVQGSAANNAGTPVGVATDIDGDTRSTTTPDIGADEFAPLTCFGVSGLSAANVSDVSFDATWSSNNSTTIGSEVRYREAGTTGAYMMVNGSGASATITGLMASTSYEFSVREICSVGDTCSWSASESMMTAACALSNQCQYTVYLTDSYGDGWNGNVVTFTQSGNVNGSVTLATGSLDTAYVGLCSWDSVSVDLGTLGSWTAEVGFVVTDAAGDTVVVHTAGSTMTAGQNFGSFLPVCTACPPADMCAFTVNMTDSYGDGWNGNTVAFVQNGYTVGT
ncbi:MAG: fibronectin type III domain-containing protein, partial [Schleiferiaceae bacterium]